MSQWRKPSVAAVWLALACTPAAAQYAPSPYAVPARPYGQPAPQSAPAQSYQPQPYQTQPYAPSGQGYGQPATATPYYSTAPSFSSVTEGLRGALEANRSGDLSRTLAYQAALTDPLARKVLTWAMVDKFGEQLGLAELERASRELQGWPREDARRSALDRARTGGIPDAWPPDPLQRARPVGGPRLHPPQRGQQHPCVQRAPPCA
jgi:hypothetical protein